MAQKKKKPSEHQIQAIAQAHYKNEFMRKLKLMINTCCGEDIFSLIPNRILEKVYLIRYHSLHIAAAGGHSIPPKLMTDLKVTFSELLKTITIELPPNGHKILLNDFMTVGISMYSIPPILEAEGIPNTNKIKSALQNFCMDEEAREDALVQLFKVLQTIGFCESNIENRFYWLDYSLTDYEGDKSGYDNHVKIYTEVPKTINVKIDGISRPALRLGWADFMVGMNWITLKPSLLNIKGMSDDKPMEVYIQSHAIRRFSERTDGIYNFIAQYNIYLSFVEPKVICDSKNNLLIEYRILDSKAGYFRFDIVGNIIVIRTFLFLTNSGTPEGDLLERNTGLKVLDREYLAIDKLSAFMSSDIGKNEQVNKIFSDAGCQSLFELYEKLETICTKQSSQSPFGPMLDYLGINKTSIPEPVLE